jgi:hypothetical protein
MEVLTTPYHIAARVIDSSIETIVGVSIKLGVRKL